MIMANTGATTVVFTGKSFNLKIIEDVDYLLDLVRSEDDVPFWAVLWPAAIGMSEYIWENIDFTGKRVLELGAGLGLVGITAAAKQASLVQSDFIQEALDFSEENAGLNGISNISYVLADWRDFVIEEKFDWILGSDILYEPKLHSYLKDVFCSNLKPGGTIVLSDPGRDYAVKFIQEMELDGFVINTVVKQVYETGRNIDVTLYFLIKNSCGGEL
jgi:predicted nicotinamide N-methyase